MRKTAITLVVIACAIVVVAVKYFHGPPVSRSPDPTYTCHKNLQKIGNAISEYAMAHNSDPPAYTVDEHGRKLHSWRVLLLPYLGMSDLYQRIDKEVPWDHPRNQEFLQNAPEVFRCPVDRGHGFTSYLALVGENTLWPGSEGYRPKEGYSSSSLICVVDVREARVNWMEPRDIDTAEIESFYDFFAQVCGKHEKRIAHCIVGLAGASRFVLPTQGGPEGEQEILEQVFNHPYGEPARKPASGAKMTTQ